MKEYASEKIGRDQSISFIRVVAMVLIVCCHMGNIIPINSYNVIAQFLNVGVQIFLFLSGWLYSEKEIKDVKKFVIKRFQKLCVPIYIWGLLSVLLVGLVFKEWHSVKDYLLILFNSQGIIWIFQTFPWDENIPWLGHLWFVSVIMICYLIMLLVKKIEKSKKGNSMTGIPVIVVTIVAAAVLLFLKIQLFYILCFFAGYFMRKKWSTLETKKYCFLTIIMVLGIVCRLLGRSYFDGTVTYDLIVSVTHIILGVWFFYTLQLLYIKFSFIQKLTYAKFFTHFDKLSFYVYITHYFFMKSPLHPKFITDNIPLQILLFAIFTLISSELLYLCCNIKKRKLK